MTNCSYYVPRLYLLNTVTCRFSMRYLSINLEILNCKSTNSWRCEIKYGLNKEKNLNNCEQSNTQIT